jgi:uncharacterized protein
MVVNNFNSLQEFLRQNDVFNRFGLSRIGIFGSFVRGEKYNDIDLLLDENLEYDKREELKLLLEQLLQVKVDLVMKKYAEPIILRHALREIKYATK